MYFNYTREKLGGVEGLKPAMMDTDRRAFCKWKEETERFVSIKLSNSRDYELKEFCRSGWLIREIKV